MSNGRRGTAGRRVALAAVPALGIGVLASCSAANSSTGSPATQGITATASAASSNSATAAAASATVTLTKPAGTVALVPITEPFDPGHPARATPGPDDCANLQTTLIIVQCYEAKTETVDAAIDAELQADFATATAAQQADMNGADNAWLAARPRVCAEAYDTGGTIDQVNIASCLLDESTARLYAARNIRPREAVLKSTDSSNPSDISWYTTPEGSRIGLVDTQGDVSGGVIIAWTVIAGADGFVVNPAQFFYGDSNFKNPGIIQKPDPSGHRVAPGTEYTFSVDYTNMPPDPNDANAVVGFVYAPDAPDAPAAVWR
jgi:uncharacterized protein YecT (DUF1311 family)